MAAEAKAGSGKGTDKPTVRLVKNGITYVYENESYWDKVNPNSRFAITIPD